jgi:membrane-bound metal-dependent hydrolase YbcI (DUF457 family)
MGNYRQHVGFAGALGAVYAAATFGLAGIPWLYGTIALLLTTLSGLLPDLDHPIGVELKGFTGILGVLAAVAVWQHVARAVPNLEFELHIWSVVITYVFIRFGLRRILAKLMVHRGISHSLPTCAVWGALTFLYYPTDHPRIRMMMALAVIVGFMSHLLLDEMCSVDLNGVRVNRAFGTAIKLWAPSPWSTVAMYGLLLYLVSKVLNQWPAGSYPYGDTIPPPYLPWPPPRLSSDSV